MKFGRILWVGLLIGALGFGVGLFSVALSGQWFSLIIITLVFLLFSFFLWNVALKPQRLRQRLEKSGVQAEARILQVTDTGVTVNNHPQIKLLMEVNSQYSGKYLVETNEVVSRLQMHLFQPGAVIPVLIDPQDKNLIVINYSSNTLSGAHNGGGVVSSVP